MGRKSAGKKKRHISKRGEEPTSEKTEGLKESVPSEGRRASRQSLFLVLGLVAAILAVYANSLHGGFVLDDFVYIVKNENIRSFDNIFSRNGHQEPRPPVYASLALNYALGGTDTTGYHVFNIFIHILVAITLFGLVRQTLRLPALYRRYGPSAHLIAFVISLLWAVHPIQTESVTYIFQRSESMQALFYLFAMYGYLRASQTRGRAKYLWYVGMLIACGLGMTSKATFVTMPAMLLLYDRVFLSGSIREVLRRRGLAVLAAVFIMSSAGLAAGDMHGMAEKQVVARSEDKAPFMVGRADTPCEYYRSQPAVILSYLGLSLWPSDLCLDYKLEPEQDMSKIIISSALLFLLIALSGVLLWKIPGLGFLVVSAFIVLAPTAAYWKLELMFEHRMYLPLAGLVGAAVIAVHRLLTWFFGAVHWPRTAVRACMIAIILIPATALGTRSVIRNRDYKDQLTMYEKVVETRPQNPRAHYNLGNRYWNRYQDLEKKKERGEANAFLKKAVSQYEESVRLFPLYIQARINLANAYMSQDRLDDAVDQLKTVISDRPDSATAVYNLAWGFERRADKKRRAGSQAAARADLEESVAFYRRSLSLRPRHVRSLHGLGFGLYSLKRFAEAVDPLVKYVKAVPKDYHAQLILGECLFRQGRYREAEKYIRSFLKARPDSEKGRRILSEIQVKTSTEERQSSNH